MLFAVTCKHQMHLSQLLVEVSIEYYPGQLQKFKEAMCLWVQVMLAALVEQMPNSAWLMNSMADSCATAYHRISPA